MGLDAQLQNLLYRRPELYEFVYHGSGDVVPQMCMRLFDRHLHRLPGSLLDIGCGTGRDLAYFAERVGDCVGVDVQEGMIAYARERRPTIDFRVGDMRTLRLGRTFEAITCLGIAIANLHSNEDVAQACATFAAHAQPGSVLIVEALNALGAAADVTLPRRFTIDAPELKATAEAVYEHDGRRQLLTRRRVWDVPGQDPVEDLVRFRTLAPLELEHHLALHGFETVDVYDNRDLLETDLSATSIVVVARFTGAV
ncbi:MAG: hypothetical protein QOK16_4499 [Solirubrobacteraceae bacterium]|jgi:SAM-dependent methyltransferase|nr:hypothetical protein [Solirubrobacteraceae bacterium]MEA2189488.1 hypothetical protein [Solirubrobacteraceae bacterium]